MYNQSTEYLSMIKVKTQFPTLKKNSVGFRLARIMWLKRRFIDIEMKPLSMTRTQWQTLHWLNMLSPCTQKQLLNYMDIDGAQLAGLLDEFEKNNIITRKQLTEDRRCLLVELTTHAKKKIIPHLEKVFERENDILLNGISVADKKKLTSLLEKIESNIDKELTNLNNKK